MHRIVGVLSTHRHVIIQIQQYPVENAEYFNTPIKYNVYNAIIMMINEEFIF